MRLTTNAAKQVTSSNTPDAFGVGSSTANTASPFQWNAGAGYRTENLAPLGLSYAYSLQKVGDRYYDPALGCFLTRDTELDQKPYAYCDGDPVNFSDPSGHQKKKDPYKPNQQQLEEMRAVLEEINRIVESFMGGIKFTFTISFHGASTTHYPSGASSYTGPSWSVSGTFSKDAK